METFDAGAAHVLCYAYAAVLRAALANGVTLRIRSFECPMAVAETAFIPASEETLGAGYAFLIVLANITVFRTSPTKCWTSPWRFFKVVFRDWALHASAGLGVYGAPFA